MKNIKSIVLAFIFLPTFSFATIEKIKIVCGPDMSNFGGNPGMFEDSQTAILIPKPPEPLFTKGAPYMSLPMSGSFTAADSRYRFNYNFTFGQLWPRFDKDGKWKTEKISIEMLLEMMIEERLPDGKRKFVGATGSRRVINFDAKGGFVKYNTQISSTLMNPLVYQMAMDNPNE